MYIPRAPLQKSVSLVYTFIGYIVSYKLDIILSNAATAMQEDSVW